MAMGKVYLVGAGPGDPGLLTLKGRRCLEAADAVVYDRLVSPRLLAYARPGTQLFCVGKRRDGHSWSQHEIHDLLRSLAKRGLTVVRLKGGDPFVFGRGGEEALALTAAGVTWEVVSGITSAISVPAYAGIPVTHRDVAAAFSVVAGHRADQSDAINWGALTPTGGSLVILMGVKQLPTLVANLQARGMPGNTSLAIIGWGTRAAQRTLVSTLDGVTAAASAQQFESPAVIVVGEVVRLRDELAWFEKLPLAGRRILVAGDAQAQSLDEAERLESLGAETFVLTTEHLYALDEVALDGVVEAFRRQPPDTGLYFCTVLVAKAFFQRWKAARLDVRQLAATSLAADSEEVAQCLAAVGVIANAVGRRAASRLGVHQWWMEQEPALPSLLLHNGQTFEALRLRTENPWLSVAERWLTDGADAIWTPGAALHPIIHALVQNSLPDGAAFPARWSGPHARPEGAAHPATEDPDWIVQP